ncbi:MAG: GDSL-type esterase/lipase family protein, partial [Planctomycetota bacterium]
CFGTTSSNDDSTIPAFFGARVRENAASPEKVDVINGGLPGATTYMSVNRYEKRLARFNPDIVILYNLVNDLLTSRRARLGIDPRTWPAVKITGTLSSWLSHSAMWLVFETARSNHYKRLRIEQVTKSDEKEHWADRREHSKKMREELDSIVGEEKIHVYDGKIENNIYIVPEHFAQFREELRRFHRVVSASGATPVFCTFAFRFTGEETVEEYRKVGPGIAMYMPDWNMARDAMRAMNDAIREVARETNSVLCDVDRELVREPGDYPEKDTDHFTDAGCAKVGALIAKVLQDQQLLQGASRPK